LRMRGYSRCHLSAPVFCRRGRQQREDQARRQSDPRAKSRGAG
jgi:hypothetical protein